MYNPQGSTVICSFVVLLFDYSVLLCSQRDHQETDLRACAESTGLSSEHVILMEQISVTSFSIFLL